MTTIGSASMHGSAGRVTKSEVATFAQLACLLEVGAPKPGNVSPGHHFADIGYEDFLASAIVIGQPMAEADARPLGTTVRSAVELSAAWARSNTNLGIVLLLAPLARAALTCGPPLLHDGTAAERTTDSDGLMAVPLRDSLRRVLDATTVDDAREVYAAIRCAAPGGLATAPAQDVRSEPTMTLVEVMRLAAHRDGVAREYATAFASTFDVGVPALDRARRDGLSWDDAIVETFLTLLAAQVDTHIARRNDEARAADVTRRAREVIEAGGVRSLAGRDAIRAFDASLRDERNWGNPGTTADLTAAAIYVVLLCGGWKHRSVRP